MPAVPINERDYSSHQRRQDRFVRRGILREINDI